MRNSKMIIVPLLGVMTAAALTVSAEPAAAQILDLVTLSSSTAVLDGDAGCGNRITVAVRVKAPVGDTSTSYTTVSAEAVAPDGDTADVLLLLNKKRSGDYVTYTDAINICGFEDPGKYRLDVKVSYVQGNEFQEDQLNAWYYVKRPTSLTYNATPEPAKAKSNLTHSGRLLFDTWRNGGWYGPSGIPLTIAFQKTGTKTYVTKATIKTTKGGYYSAKIRTDADGTWRVTYPNNNTRQTVVKTDYVDTK